MEIILALLATVLLSSSVPATQSSGSIDGIVVRAGTTEPISGVDIELTRIEGTPAFPLEKKGYPQGTFSPGAIVQPTAPNPADDLTTRTKSGGRFRFSDLKPGTYRLLASRAGGAYFPAEYGQRDPKGPGLNIVLGEGESLRDARMEMAATGTISGRVLDEDGNPAGRVRVMAIDSSWKYGKQTLGIVEALYTDDRGQYRFFWLPPGRYYISAKPEDPRRQNLSLLLFPPGAADPTREFLPRSPVMHRLLPSGETVEEVVDPVYHGGGPDMKSARAIELAPGANVGGIDISLNGSRGRARHIRGIVVDSAGRPISHATVGALSPAEGPSVVSPSITMATPANGTFELSGVGPGPYILRAIDVGGRRPGGSEGPIALMPIPAGIDNIDNVTLVVTRGLSIPGRVAVEGPDLNGKEADTLGFRLSLVPDGPRLPFSDAASTIDGVFTLTGVQPGNYHMSISPILNVYTGPPNSFPAPVGALRNYYVKSIRLGPVDVLNDGIRVESSIEGEFQIVLGANGGIIEGQVEESGRGPVPNATVVLIPDSSLLSRPDLYKSVNSDRNGHYSIHGIAPGDYRLYAWQRIEDGIWFDPDFVRANRGQGTVVHVVEGTNPTVTLSAVRP